MKVPQLFILKNNQTLPSPKYKPYKKLAKLIKEQHKQIDKKSDQEKKEIEYIAEITEHYWPQLAEIFDPENNSSFEELSKTLFKETKRLIEKLEEYCNPIRNTFYHGGPEKCSDYEISLGWAKLREYSHKTYTYYATEEGTEILDGLRIIREQPLIKDTNQKLKDMFHR